MSDIAVARACTDSGLERELSAMDEFCVKLRKLPSCKDAVFVFIIEANLDWTRAKFLAQHAKAYAPCTTMYEDPKNLERPGVWMTQQRKEQMNNDVNFFFTLDAMHILPLEHKNNHLVGLGSAQDTKATLESFGRQLKNYRRKVDKSSTDPSRECKARYTGKAAGMKDDMVMAFEIAVHWGIAFLADETYVSQFNTQPEIVLNRIRPELNELYS